MIEMFGVGHCYTGLSYVTLSISGNMGFGGDRSYYANYEKAERYVNDVVREVTGKMDVYPDFIWDVQKLRDERKDLVAMVQQQSEALFESGRKVSIIRPRLKKDLFDSEIDYDLLSIRRFNNFAEFESCIKEN